MNSHAHLPVTRLWTVAFTALFAVLTLILLPTTPAGAAFPGSNGKIAFETDSIEVWTMNPDGSGLTNVTNNPAFDGTPSWSADGTKIAFFSTRTGGSDIYTMNADGTSQVQVSSSAEGDFFPAWSPDGTKIAFHSFRNGNGDIFVINVDGTGEAGVTTAAEVDEVPSWSPDGTRIAFHSSRRDEGAPSSDYDIFTIAPDGSAESNLTNNTGIDDSMPNWSPDGTQIVFIRNGEVWKINANGTGGDTQLTTSGGTALEPVWSPDGTKIAYSGGPTSDIFTINADGTGQINLTNSAAIDGSPDWQPTASPPAAGDHDVGVAGGGFRTRGHVDASRSGPGPYPVKIKVKNFGDTVEDVGYSVSSSSAGDVLSSSCSGTVAGVAPGSTATVSGCTVTYAGVGDRTLTLAVSHDDTDGGVDSDSSNNTKSKNVTVVP